MLKTEKVILLCGILLMPLSASARQKVLSPEDYHCSAKQNVEFCVDRYNVPLTGKISTQGNDGSLASLENFKNGFRSGLSTVFDKKGRLVSRTYFKEGLKNGSERLYYENRTIKTVANYKNGILDGRLEHYTPKGKLLGRIIYKNGYVMKGYCNSGHGTKKKKINFQNLRNFRYNHIVSCGG